MGWHSLWNPSIYHGHKKKKGFFEGWYFKVVDREEQNPLAFIPGIFLGPEPGESHSFLQVLQGNPPASHYFRLDVDDFKASRKSFQVQVGNSSFGPGGFSLNLEDEGQELKGTLEFSEQVFWPRRPWAPGIMGPFSFVPFMECNHDVISMDHKLQGSLSINGREYDFSGGRGYLEKDWGKSFPRSWIWLQSNHFSGPGTSLMASLARVPWLGSYFPGFLAAFYHQKKLHLFSTYNRSRISRLDTGNDGLHWHLTHPSGRELLIYSQQEGGEFLHAPSRQAMEARGVKESITATLEVTLLQDGQEIFWEQGRSAGLEISGEPESIISPSKTR